jgi:catechol 2,3-dioxygenase-like lactoylglutathione lyase family enzyme
MLAERRAHATLPVADLDAAKAFWGDRLGFEAIEDNPVAVMYRGGDDSVFVVTLSSGRATGAHTQIGFTTPDIEGDVADLKARGVTLEEYDVPGLRTADSIATTGAGRAAWFKDPDGNLVGLIEFAPARS